MRKYVLVLLGSLLAAPVHSQPRRFHVPVPNPAQAARLSVLSTVAIGVVFCGAASLIVTTAIEQRELKLSEAYSAVADCVLPFIGPILVQAAFARHPDWDK